MRAAWLALVLASGCVLPTLDLDESIVLVPEGEWPPWLERDVVLAAQCWNLEFGTKLIVDRAGGGGAQRVSIELNELACLRGAGGYHPRFVGEIDVCPEPAVLDIMFVVVLHELGHVLNIYEHGTTGVMAPSAELTASPSPILFDAEDHALFDAANPGHVDRGCTVAREYPLPCACP
jgi:hypothetical protein